MADYTTIDDPSAQFQVDLYTGTGSSLANTFDGNSAMQPDLVWIKERSGTADHALYDSSRGVQKQLEVNLTAVETTESTGLTAFGSDGFTVGALAQVNTSSDTYVAWGWKANGSTTVSVAESGSGSGCVNACTHQANTTSGFSIITYTGRDDELSNGQESKLTHGLGVAPKFTIMKRRAGAVGEWYVMGKYVTSSSAYSNNEFLQLNQQNAINSDSYTGDTAPDSTHIFLGNELVNIADATYVCFAFTDVQGFSKFGHYTGNDQDPDGTFIYTGFKVGWLLVKNPASALYHWALYDSKRSPTNEDHGDIVLTATDDPEVTGNNGSAVDLLSNGFKWRGGYDGVNGPDNKIIYAAFAENPFVTSTGIPATAR